MTTSDNRRLLCTRDGVVAGVCGGVARFFGLDASLVRLVALLLILFGGLSIWAYIILWILIPKAPRQTLE